jgi:hypothetical protein
MKFHLLYALLFVSVTHAAEPAQKIEPMEITDVRNKAAEYAFTQGLLHTKVAEKCQKLPEPIRSRAKMALDEWRERNQFLVSPTFFWVNYVGTVTTPDKNASQDYVYRTLTAFNSKAKAMVEESIPGRKPSSDGCEAWLIKFADASLDLKVSEHAASLQEIREYSYKFSVPEAGR